MSKGQGCLQRPFNPETPGWLGMRSMGSLAGTWLLLSCPWRWQGISMSVPGAYPSACPLSISLLSQAATQNLGTKDEKFKCLPVEAISPILCWVSLGFLPDPLQGRHSWREGHSCGYRSLLPSAWEIKGLYLLNPQFPHL